MGHQQSGDIVVVRSQDANAIRSPRGALLVARRDEPVQSHRSDLSNVVPFARSRRHAAEPPLPFTSVAPADRPAASPPNATLLRRAGTIAGSLALHGAVLALFLLNGWLLALLWPSTPLASIGVEVISVEITLGDNIAAGFTAEGEQETQVAAASDRLKPDERVAEKANPSTQMPQEVPVAARETAPEIMQEPEQTRLAAERPEVKVEQTEPELNRIDAPTEQKTEQKKKETAAPAPSDTAKGIGRGRSDADTNYNGQIASHLQRHKQYPAAARAAGAQGIATVSFSIDGGGRVISVRLVSGSHVSSIDHEAVAMVHRASPFPRPPDGQGRNFTVPVKFNLR
jgi:TonB family protein